MKIDIIVPYVDENDKAWQEDFNRYKEEEIKLGIQSPSNRQAFAKERVRDWNTFRYWFRSVEKNCPWVNKVFLVVQRESQIPEWLDRNNPKLRIVYHEEFIPKELLPTFSTLVIETFYYRIPDLSEYFIVSNDDFFFLNPIPEHLFFRVDKILQGVTGTRKRDWQCGNKEWESIINNNNNFIEKYILKKPTEEFYHYSHLPDGRVKSFETDFMKKYYDIIYKAMSVSRFRHKDNLIPSLLFIDTMKYTNFGLQNPRLYRMSKYVAVNAQTNFKEFKDCEMVCFNDTADVRGNFNACKSHMLSFLSSKFPNKSSFELNESSPLKVCFGVISWLPENEDTRKQRVERLNKMFEQIQNIFGDVNFMIVAQNWKDYELPANVNAEVFRYNKLGILGARKTLGKHFLESNYDYLIMLDDDIVLETTKGFSREYFFDMLNRNRDGFMFLQYSWSLTFCAISKFIYEECPMVDIDPEKGEGYEDVVYPWLLHCKCGEYEFTIDNLKFIQHQGKYANEVKSTWSDGATNWSRLDALSRYYVHNFKKGNFKIDKKAAETFLKQITWYDKAIWYGWVKRQEYEDFKKEYEL